MKHAARISFDRLAGSNADVPLYFVNWRNHRQSLSILLLFVFFVLSVGKYELNAVIIYAVFPLLLVTAGRLPIVMILKKLFLLSPFVLIMAAANPFLDRTPFITAGSVTISSGMVSGMVILLKSFVTITAVVAFSICVPFYRICEVLRDFRVPDVFVTQLVLLYRYSFLLIDEAMAMQKARNMRSFGARGKGVFITAKMIGSLLLRTKDKADRVYRGMLARGFDGDLTKRKPEKIRAAEVIVVLFSFSVFTIIRIIF